MQHLHLLHTNTGAQRKTTKSRTQKQFGRPEGERVERNPLNEITHDTSKKLRGNVVSSTVTLI